MQGLDINRGEEKSDKAVLVRIHYLAEPSTEISLHVRKIF